MKVGIETVHELREKLKFERQRVTQSYHPYDFFNFVVTAWHLHHDWIKNDKQNRPNLFYKKVNQAPPQMKELVNATRDLANGSKHFRLDKPNDEKKVLTEVHKPEIRDHFTYVFGPQPGISVANAYYTIGELVDILDEYFEWLFDDLTPADSFPDKLQKMLMARVL
ncbi:hypothetical protein CGK32_23845 [Vibrio parahaemolyticus]|uniref:hypothetical protein n=1 Tax=Vibrio harveyi group TaxID=717610 RepID=UPI00111F0B2E|nr:hypothetical protein [Vibrio parahaemolyticus]TOA15516.1 hypothetical protein CGK32_23845 [Vibrio parahaemolyticus]